MLRNGVELIQTAGGLFLDNTSNYPVQLITSTGVSSGDGKLFGASWADERLAGTAMADGEGMTSSLSNEAPYIVLHPNEYSTRDDYTPVSGPFVTGAAVRLALNPAEQPVLVDPPERMRSGRWSSVQRTKTGQWALPETMPGKNTPPELRPQVLEGRDDYGHFGRAA